MKNPVSNGLKESKQKVKMTDGEREKERKKDYGLTNRYRYNKMNVFGISLLQLQTKKTKQDKLQKNTHGGSHLGSKSKGK